MAGRAKENLRGRSLKYLFVYFKICIFKCSYRIYFHNPEYLGHLVIILIYLGSRYPVEYIHCMCIYIYILCVYQEMIMVRHTYIYIYIVCVYQEMIMAIYIS